VDKIEENSKVRLRRTLYVGGTHIKANTVGTVKSVSGGMFSKKYSVRWRGVNFDIAHVAKDIALQEE
jgi:hypothetical protein